MTAEDMNRTEEELTLHIVKLTVALAQSNGELKSLHDEVDWLRSQVILQNKQLCIPPTEYPFKSYCSTT